MKIKTMAVLLLVLLLCAGSSIAQDLLSPSVNIIAEFKKLNHMDRRIQKLEETLTKVLSENEALKTLVQDSQKKLESLQKENEGKKVAFSAGLLASGTGQIGPFSYYKNLEYKKVFSNVGNAYDSNTGIFTAPVKGVYYFRFYGHCHGGTTMAITLLKNGQNQCSVHDWKPDSNGNASNGVVLTLEIGDKINTVLWKDTWVYDDPASYTSFSGFMIFPL
ncbi:complement component 1, q subcomponent-like 4 like [Megalobrama amblycephala]|uniref:complement component 1, q subcomponent-like 4 like n=1 Tax=Megalobrama amblycephala TaxID=75352 RepID=UPI0020145A0C|nr:complement component 1, q subcomponent-like 4 like [Megalobrama amblycephala]